MSFEEENPVLKVILVGSVGVGKTSIINSYFESGVNKNEIPTVAPASCNFTVTLDDGVNVNLQVWDTAGQEKYQSISQMFYRDSKVVIVCYTYDEENSIKQWIERVRSQVPDCNVILVTTKADLLTQKQQTEIIERGNEYVEKYRCSAHLISSAKTEFGIKEIFQEAAKFYDDSAVQVTSVKVNETRNGRKKCCK